MCKKPKWQWLYPWQGVEVHKFLQIRYLEEGSRVHQTEMEWLRMKMQHKHEHEITVLKQRHDLFEKDSKQVMDELMCAACHLESMETNSFCALYCSVTVCCVVYCCPANCAVSSGAWSQVRTLHP